MKNFDIFLQWFYESKQGFGCKASIENWKGLKHTLQLIHARMICKEPQIGFITLCCHGKWEEAVKHATAENFIHIGYYILFVDYCNMKLDELTKIK